MNRFCMLTERFRRWRATASLFAMLTTGAPPAADVIEMPFPLATRRLPNEKA